jgi:hypothetical protein
MTERRARLTRRLPHEALAAAAARVSARATPAAKAAHALLASAGPATAAARRAAGPTPARATEIQASLSAFRDTVVARQPGSDAPVPRVLEWVAAHLLGRGRPACSEAELHVVLDVLALQDAVMVTRGEGAAQPSTVWFV